MKTTQSIAFYCRASKANKSGLAPIELGITVNGRRLFVNLPRKEKPREFERGYDDLSTYLSAVRLRVNEVITELTLNGTPVTADSIREYMRYGGRKSYTVQRLLNESLSNVRQTCHSYGGIRKYEQVIGMFLSVVDPMREACTISPEDVRAYVGLLDHYQASSRAMMFTKLKTLIKFGMREGVITSDPFRNERITRPAPTVTYLTEEELDRIRKTDYHNESLARVADVLLFQASCGLAYSDLKDLSPEDLKVSPTGFFLQKRRHKTGVEFVAPIIDGGEAIFFKYQGKLPLLSNQKMNAYAKAIADLAGIKTRMTTHLFRRTYCCRLVRMGVRIEVTAVAMGHGKNITTTLRHYASLGPDTVLEEVSRAFGK